MNPPLLTFLSDFGAEDWFVGVVHGVVLQIAPAARVVDITHAIPPGDVPRAAFVLEAAAPDFPPETVHMAVVDPSVGTERRALAVRARGQVFVGPDNGVLDWALTDAGAEVRSLTEEHWFRQPVSRTFHGRDVFAPVAAHLASGAAFDTVGIRITDPVRLTRPPVVHGDGMLRGSVVFVDRFGNALTDLTAEAIARAFPGVPEESLEVRVFEKRVARVSRSYGDAPIGTLVAILGSSGRLELAEVGGHAASRWGIGTRDRVEILRRGAAG